MKKEILLLPEIQVSHEADIKDNEFMLKSIITDCMSRHCMAIFMKRHNFGRIGRVSKRIKNRPILVTYKDLENFVVNMENFMKQSKGYRFASLESIKAESPLVMSYFKIKETITTYKDIRQPKQRVDFKALYNQARQN